MLVSASSFIPFLPSTPARAGLGRSLHRHRVAERRSPRWGQAPPSTLRPSFARGGETKRAGLGRSAVVRRFLPHQHAWSLRRRPRVAERCSRGLGRGCGRPGTTRRGAAGGEGSAAASLGGATAGLGSGQPRGRYGTKQKIEWTSQFPLTNGSGG